MAPKDSKSKSKKQPSVLVKGYLFAYNFIQTIGWSYLLYQLITYYTHPQNGNVSLYDTVKYTVFIFQNAAILEVVHTAIGLVPSNVFLTFFQVASRVIVVVGILLASPDATKSPGLPLCLLAWSITEIIRYSYYALNIVNAVPYLLIYLRYTLFIALYPIGVTGELLCMYAAQSYFAQTKKWSMELPNTINFTFSYQYFILIVMLLYIPIFPQLYGHMFIQRKKILGGDSAKKQK